MGDPVSRRLYDATAANAIRTVEYLLECGGDPNYILVEGISPIHLAANRSTDAVRLMLKNGGNPNVRSVDGDTPLHVASSWGKSDIVNILIKAGGDPFLRDSDGYNAFDLAKINKRHSTLSILNAKFDVNSPIDELSQFEQTNISESSICSLLNKAMICSDSFNSTTSTVCFIDEFHHLDDKGNVEFIEEVWGKTYVISNPPSLLTLSRSSSASSIVSTSKESGLASNSVDSSPETVNLTNIHQWRSYISSKYETESQEVANGDLQVNSANTSGISSVPSEIVRYPDQDLRQRLLDLGDKPGPLTTGTRRVYQRRLAKLLKHPPAPKTTPDRPIFGHAIHQVLLKTQAVNNFASLASVFVKLTPGIKNYFCYLLMDPRVTQNLPLRISGMTDLDGFHVFLASVFYIGKGCRTRALQHLSEALDYRKQPQKKQANAKVDHILDIWRSGGGVISHHCFINSSSTEALNREALMIDAIGLGNLTNCKHGEYYGECKVMKKLQRIQLGTYLLYQAYQTFLIEGERQLFPSDISKKA